MAQENFKDKNLSKTAQVEKEALNLISNDIKLADQQRPTENSNRRPVSYKERVKQAREEMYGDKSVPRVRYERRVGGSSHSRAYLKRDYSLYSDKAQLFFESHYESVNMSLIVSTLVIEAVGGPELAQKVSDEIEGEFRKLEQEMMTTLGELSRIAAEKGIPSEKQVPAYDHLRTYTPPVHTPHSVQFMTVTTLFDRIVSRCEGCWINQIMSADTKARITSSWSKKLKKFVTEIYQIRQEALKQARKAGFAKRAAAIDERVHREHANETLGKADVTTQATAKKTKDAANQTEAPATEAAVQSRTARTAKNKEPKSGDTATQSSASQPASQKDKSEEESGTKPQSRDAVTKSADTEAAKE